jgi:small GTP-binding protein
MCIRDRARRDQQEVLVKLLDSLQKVDNLPEEQLAQVRDALFHTDIPYLVALVGPFSAGKSSIINALLGEAILEVGAVPTTDHIHMVRYGEERQRSRVGETSTVFHPSPLLENLSFVDTPGLESVFEKHDQITRQFLHRADLVLMIMVATHVLSAANLDFLKEMRAYGKRLIIVVNQIDLLEDDERETVRNFVAEQSRLHLGIEPIIWMVSAKQALEASRDPVRDELAYDESGFGQIEDYLTESLNDSVRIRQKLETSLQIANNVREKALESVKNDQSALASQQKSVQNIQNQIEQALKGQALSIETGLRELETQWADATQRGTSAIRDLFQLGNALKQIAAGLGEISGLTGFFLRFGGKPRAQAAFDEKQVALALNKIPEMVDKLGARLEGRDLQDLDDLVSYTRGQIEALPPNLKDKVIGKVQSPMNYDRSFLRNVRHTLDEIMLKATRFETAKLEARLRNTVALVALWEVVVIALAILGVVTAAQALEGSTALVFFAGAAGLIIFPLFLMPIQGALLARGYRQQMEALQAQYIKPLREALAELQTYSRQVRQDTVAPYVRLIETQTRLVDDLKREFDESEQAIQRIQRGIAVL